MMCAWHIEPRGQAQNRENMVTWPGVTQSSKWLSKGWATTLSR